MTEKKPRKTFYPSTVSRRDFMKVLGLGALATSAASAMGGPFKDVDEMLASPQAVRNRPSWIKEVDQPTVEIDWDLIRDNPFDGSEVLFDSFPKYFSQEELGQIMGGSAKAKVEGANNNTPGLTTRDQALSAAAGWGAHQYIRCPWTGDERAKSAEQIGIPKWEGTPEENARMLRVAGRYFGASEVGFVKITEDTKGLIYSHALKAGSQDPFRRAVEWEDVDAPYETDEKVVIPNNKELWAVVMMIPQSLIMYQMGKNGGFGGETGFGYAKINFVAFRMHAFLQGLGYQHMGSSGMQIAPTSAFAVLAGMGELGRSGTLVTPKYGNAIRSTIVLYTDLPLAEDKPIDAGITRFCETCKKCAEACPSGALSLGEPSWDVAGPWTKPGVKTWKLDAPKCWSYMAPNMCVACNSVCPYNKMDQAVMHDLVKFSIAKLPVFNGIIRQLDDTFGYGLVENPEVFWEMEDLPLYGYDPSRFE